MHTVASMGGYIADAADEVGPRWAAARHARASRRWRGDRCDGDAAHVRSASEPGRAGGLVGRAYELAVLRSALGDAADGIGRLVLVVGEPGIGKARLAQEIAGRALAGGHAVAWGRRCVEADGAPPYWPWLQILRTLGLHTDTLLATIESPEERFSRYDDVTSGDLPAGRVGGHHT